MKLLASILAVYILALNFVPCGDTADEYSNNALEITQNIDMDHGHGEYDDCSPFCECQCCQNFVTQINITSDSQLSRRDAHNIILYSEIPGKDLKSSLLQPPRA